MQLCAYRGEATGEKVICQSCRGRVELRLFFCVVYGKCTQNRRITDIACCNKCPDYMVKKD